MKEKVEECERKVEECERKVEECERKVEECERKVEVNTTLMLSYRNLRHEWSIPLLDKLLN